MTPDPTVTLDQARAFWHARQGLARPPSEDPAEVVARTGWARTLGGIDVYLAVKRVAAFVRDELGHARSFSLDTDEAVRARAAALRSVG